MDHHTVVVLWVDQ